MTPVLPPMLAVTVPQTPGEKQARRAALDQIRTQLGWTQNGWARRAKVNPQFASKVLSGKVNAPGAWRRLERRLLSEWRRRARRAERAA